MSEACSIERKGYGAILKSCRSLLPLWGSPFLPQASGILACLERHAAGAGRISLSPWPSCRGLLQEVRKNYRVINGCVTGGIQQRRLAVSNCLKDLRYCRVQLELLSVAPLELAETVRTMTEPRPQQRCRCDVLFPAVDGGVRLPQAARP